MNKPDYETVKLAIDPDVILDTILRMEPLTSKELIEDVKDGDRRNGVSQALTRESRVYTNTRFAMRIGTGKTNDDLVEAISALPSGRDPETIKAAKATLKKFDADYNKRTGEYSLERVIGTSPSGNYLIGFAGDLRVLVDGFLFETIVKHCKGFSISGVASDQAIVFRSPEKPKQWAAVLMPCMGQRVKLDVRPAGLWTYYGFTAFECCEFIVDKPKKAGGEVLFFDCRATDLMSGNSAHFIVKPTDEDWKVEVVLDNANIDDRVVLGTFTDHPEALKAVAEISRHVANIDDRGRMAFAL